MTQHETCKFQIDGYIVDVDKGMVPLIAKLNSMEGVKTWHCCQGEYESETGELSSYDRPYVHFTCKTLENLREVLNLFSWAPRYTGMPLSVNTFYPDDVLSFTYTFPNKQCLERTIKRIEKEK